MNFMHALSNMREGHLVRRHDWADKHLFLSQDGKVSIRDGGKAVPWNGNVPDTAMYVDDVNAYDWEVCT